MSFYEKTWVRKTLFYHKNENSTNMLRSMGAIVSSGVCDRKYTYENMLQLSVFQDMLEI